MRVRTLGFFLFFTALRSWAIDPNPETGKSAYEILGIDPRTPYLEMQKQAKKIQRSLAQNYHPDTSTDPAVRDELTKIMSKINGAVDDIMALKSQPSVPTAYEHAPPPPPPKREAPKSATFAERKAAATATLDELEKHFSNLPESQRHWEVIKTFKQTHEVATGETEALQDYAIKHSNELFAPGAHPRLRSDIYFAVANAGWGNVGLNPTLTERYLTQNMPKEGFRDAAALWIVQLRHAERLPGVSSFVSPQHYWTSHDAALGPAVKQFYPGAVDNPAGQLYRDLMDGLLKGRPPANLASYEQKDLMICLLERPRFMPGTSLAEREMLAQFASYSGDQFKELRKFGTETLVDAVNAELKAGNVATAFEYASRFLAPEIQSDFKNQALRLLNSIALAHPDYRTKIRNRVRKAGLPTESFNGTQFQDRCVDVANDAFSIFK